MFKLLLKKELIELAQIYYMDNKNNKKRNPVSIALYVFLFLIAYISMFVSFMATAHSLGSILFGSDNVWLYFAINALMAVAVGVVASVFSSYHSLYLAKDNDLLLSMPIKPVDILMARMSKVYLLSFVFTAMAFLPSLVYYYYSVGFDLYLLICGVAALLFLSLLVATLTFFFAYLLALLTRKTKANSFITVFFSLVLIFLYYLFYYRLNTMMNSLLLNVENISDFVSFALFLFYWLAEACLGNLLYLLLFVAFIVLLFFVCCLIMKKNYVRIMTASSATTNKKVDISKSRVSAVQTALLKKEFKRFTSSATYMLNNGFGLVMSIVMAVMLIIKKDLLLSAVDTVIYTDASYASLIPVLLFSMVCLMVSTNPISAPSISLEGKTFWLLKSLPVDMKDVLKAKERFCVLMNLGPMMFLLISAMTIFKIDIIVKIEMIIDTILYIYFMADLGLIMNVLMPNFTWTNEVVIIKQSLAVGIVLLGGMAMATLFTVFAYLLRYDISVNIYLLLVLLVLLIIRVIFAYLLNNVFNKKLEKIA